MQANRYNGERGYFRGYAIALTKDSGCVITGRTTKGEGYLLKTDKDGNEEWRMILSSKTMLKDVMETKDGCFILTGTSEGPSVNADQLAYGKPERSASVLCVFKVKHQ